MLHLVISALGHDTLGTEEDLFNVVLEDNVA